MAITRFTVVLVAFVACLQLFLTIPASALREYPETGYSVANGRFLDYLDHRGGPRTFGYPISREYDFMGTRVQLFERAILERRPDWSTGPMNLDGDLFPYTHVAGMTLPAIDQQMARTLPSLEDADYVAKALDFLKANAPDEWEGLPTRFYSTYKSTVNYEEAFPLGDADPGMIDAVNLEVWGLPISKPTRDPNNRDFVYLRFQRGILQFDANSGESKWLPLGQYLKAIITGQNLPGDLEQEAKSSSLYKQYDNSQALGVARPQILASTNLFAAFEKDGIDIPTPVPTPAPTVVLVAAAPTQGPTATPAVPTKPERVEVIGSDYFIDQTNSALSMVPDPRDYIWKIVETTGTSRFDIPNHTLYVIEPDAFCPTLRNNRDMQIQWYAGWIAHVTVHAEQYWTKRPWTGLAAEQEARYRQKDVLLYNDSSDDGMLARTLTTVINKNNLDFGEFAKP